MFPYIHFRYIFYGIKVKIKSFIFIWLLEDTCNVLSIHQNRGGERASHANLQLISWGQILAVGRAPLCAQALVHIVLLEREIHRDRHVWDFSTWKVKGHCALNLKILKVLWIVICKSGHSNVFWASKDYSCFLRKIHFIEELLREAYTELKKSIFGATCSVGNIKKRLHKYSFAEWGRDLWKSAACSHHRLCGVFC